MQQPEIALLGIGMGSRGALTLEGRELLLCSRLCIGAERVISFVRKFLLEEGTEQMPEFLCGYGPETILPALVQQKKTYGICDNTVIVLSGDSGFYSGAQRLKDALLRSGYPVKLYPGISSLACLSAKAQIPWQDQAVVSLHGTQCAFIRRVRTNRYTFFLLGGSVGAAELCRKLCDYQMENVKVIVGSGLGSRQEQITEGTARQLMKQEFPSLSAAIVENDRPECLLYDSIPDEEWIRGRVPMTKQEIRSLSIAKLRLTKAAVLYDIGAGTGSIAIEAALKSQDMTVYAVEQKEDGIALMEQNKRKFGTDHVITVCGRAPDICVPLPTPTHAVIGGSGGTLKQLVKMLIDKNPAIRIVVQAMTLETQAELFTIIQEGTFYQTEMLQVQACRAEALGTYHRMQPQTPVLIGVMQKEQQ